MDRKFITKIAAAAASLTLLAGAVTAPANSFLSVVAPVTSIEAFAGSSTYADTTGLFEVKFDNDSFVSGVFQGKEAYISGVDTTKIPQSGIITIPDNITVRIKDSNGKNVDVTRPVTTITQSAFTNKKSIIKVNLPSTLKTIGNYAFSNSGLVALNLPASVTSVGMAAFQNCKGLYNVEYKGSMPDLQAFWSCDNLKYFNNSVILNHNPRTGEPILNSKVAQAMSSITASTYDSYKKVPVLKQYATEYINYIVKTNTKTSDNPVIKARKLHDWLIQHTEYDNAAATKKSSTAKEDWACIFRKKSNGKYSAVCAGYSGAYKLLCNAAGIDCYCVEGDAIYGNDIGHMWNVVKIAGNYYHVDTTWDDNDPEKPYENFMRSDYAINKYHTYKWAGIVDNQFVSRSTGGAAPYDLRYLGYINTDDKFDEADATEIQYYTLKLHDPTPKQLMRADMNLDGTVDLSDAVFIRQIIYKMNQANYTDSPFEFVYLDGKMGI